MEKGRPRTSQQYLECALEPTDGSSDDAVENDQRRARLIDFFDTEIVSRSCDR